MSVSIGGVQELFDDQDKQSFMTLFPFSLFIAVFLIFSLWQAKLFLKTKLGRFGFGRRGDLPMSLACAALYKPGRTRMRETVDPMAIRDDLASRYQVSRGFLEKMMPMIEQICSDMPEHRPRLLDLVEESVRRQAETESILFEASKSLEHLCRLNRGSTLFCPVSSRRQTSVRSQRNRKNPAASVDKAV